MGICRRNVSHWRLRLASPDMYLCRIFCKRSVRPASGYWNYDAHLHTYFSKHGDDDRDVANHRRAPAIDQLQRLVCADDHVWTRAREQRLDPPKGYRLNSV